MKNDNWKKGFKKQELFVDDVKSDDGTKKMSRVEQKIISSNLRTYWRKKLREEENREQKVYEIKKKHESLRRKTKKFLKRFDH